MYICYISYIPPSPCENIEYYSNGQMIIIDIPSSTVLVMTGVSEDGPWQVELNAIFQAAINAKSNPLKLL